MSGETPGHLLGGTVRYTQLASGFRTGIEPVLLAAAVPAQAGERVLEAGTGAGAALLCLAARLPGVAAVGVERDPVLAALASRNIADNGWSARLSVITADVVEAGAALGRFEHACANPPWHDPASTASADAARRAAKQGQAGLVASWAAALASCLRRHGSLTFILPAALLTEALAGLDAADCGTRVLAPLWPKPARPAKLILVQGRKSGRGHDRVTPGLVLHRPDGSITEEAERIFRAGAAWPI